MQISLDDNQIGVVAFLEKPFPSPQPTYLGCLGSG
jgi:hypothetical protein